MPRSVTAEDLGDGELPPAEMPAHLIARMCRPLSGRDLPPTPKPGCWWSAGALAPVLRIIKARTPSGCPALPVNRRDVAAAGYRVRRHLENHDLDDTAHKLISGQLLVGESSAI
jgi:hypothetical protein